MRLLVLAVGLAACTTITTSPPSPLPSATAAIVETQSPSPGAPTAAASPAAPTGPQRSVVTFYRTEDVIRGPAQPTKRIDVSSPVYDLQFGPDPRWAITSGVGERTPLRLLDLETGAVTTFALNLPAEALHQRSLVRWLQDGRLLITGREIWIGGPRGEDLRSVFTQFPFEVAPSPSGRRLAITTLGSSEIVVLDLGSGTTRILTGPFRPCVQDGGVGITWAFDERMVAATDCSDQAQGGMQTRFVRVADGGEVRTIPGVSIVGWPPNGDVIARGPLTARDGMPELWIISADGSRRSIPSVGFLLSADGRFLLGSVIRDAPTASDPTRRAHFAQLVDAATGRVHEVGEGMPVGWTSRGEIALISLF